MIYSVIRTGVAYSVCQCHLKSNCCHLKLFLLYKWIEAQYGSFINIPWIIFMLFIKIVFECICVSTSHSLACDGVNLQSVIQSIFKMSVCASSCCNSVVMIILSLHVDQVIFLLMPVWILSFDSFLFNQILKA